MNEQAPKRMGDYEILGVLGAGGMGRVYRVRNVITDRIEAMKVLLPDLQGHEDVAARFLREIKVLAALRHPHIAALLTALTIDNQLVMIMEFVEGRSMSSRLGDGAVPVPDAVRYIDQVLDALSYAHRQQIVHRDIKPANVMLTAEDSVKLMDFGIARASAEPNKLTATGSTLGSISYMSPEQVTGANVDARSDLYSVGISLYEMVTGQRPFQGDSDFSIMAAQINQVPTPPVELHPDMPPALNEIILTAIAKSPEQRFQSADAFRNALRAVKQELRDSKTVVMGSDNPLAGGAAARTMQMPAGTQPGTAAAATVAAVPTPPRSSPGFTPPPPRTVLQPPPVQAAAPPQPVMAASASTHRGLYITLGAVIVLAVLVAAGLYLPKFVKSPIAAEQPKQPAITQPAQQQPPQAAPAVTTTQAAPIAPEPAPSQLENPGGGTPAGKKGFASSNGTAAAENAAAARASEQAAREQLDKLEREIDQISSRAGAVNSSLDRMQQQQAAAGYGLRGDMAGHQSSMNLNLSKAQDAVQHGDAERAKRYADAATRDLEALESFLGR